jgi:hypothetical protein
MDVGRIFEAALAPQTSPAVSRLIQTHHFLLDLLINVVTRVHQIPLSGVYLLCLRYRSERQTDLDQVPDTFKREYDVSYVGV